MNTIRINITQKNYLRLSSRQREKNHFICVSRKNFFYNINLNSFSIKSQCIFSKIYSVKSSKIETSKFFWNVSFNKGRLKNFVFWCFINYGQRKTISILEKLQKIGFNFATKAGISLSIDDLKIPPKKNSLLFDADTIIQEGFLNYKKAKLTGLERFQRIIETWHMTSENLKDEMIKYFKQTNILNPVYMMAFSGARGNISQVRQLVAMRGLMADPQGKILDFPIRSNFREGLTLTEYVISCYGARKGVVDTALRTANAGYLTRRLVDVAQHVVVLNLDCGTKRGFYLTEMKQLNKTLFSLSQRLLGRVLAADIYSLMDVSNMSVKNNLSQLESKININNTIQTQNNDIKDLKILNPKIIAFRNQEISEKLATKIAKSTNKVLIRSPLTCETPRLVCQLCYGWSLSEGHLVGIGEAVGIIAAQSIGEPGTQLTMRTFHTGGVFAGELFDQLIAPFDGIIKFTSSIPGTLVRTTQGKIAFLTKTSGQLELKKSFLGAKEKQCYKIPAYTLLFLKNNEKVFKNQLIAQLAFLSSRLKKKGEITEFIVKSNMEGELCSGSVNIIEKSTDSQDTIIQSTDWGIIWIFSGKICELPMNSSFFISQGDFVDKFSTLSQIKWKFPFRSFLDTNTLLKNYFHTTKFYDNKHAKSSYLIANSFHHKLQKSCLKNLQLLDLKEKLNYLVFKSKKLNLYSQINQIKKEETSYEYCGKNKNLSFKSTLFSFRKNLKQKKKISRDLSLYTSFSFIKSKNIEDFSHNSPKYVPTETFYVNLETNFDKISNSKQKINNVIKQLLNRQIHLGKDLHKNNFPSLFKKIRYNKLTSTQNGTIIEKNRVNDRKSKIKVINEIKNYQLKKKFELSKDQTNFALKKLNTDNFNINIPLVCLSIFNIYYRKIGYFFCFQNKLLYSILNSHLIYLKNLPKLQSNLKFLIASLNSHHIFRFRENKELNRKMIFLKKFNAFWGPRKFSQSLNFFDNTKFCITKQRVLYNQNQYYPFLMKINLHFLENLNLKKKITKYEKKKSRFLEIDLKTKSFYSWLINSNKLENRENVRDIFFLPNLLENPTNIQSYKTFNKLNRNSDKISGVLAHWFPKNYGTNKGGILTYMTLKDPFSYFSQKRECFKSNLIGNFFWINFEFLHVKIYKIAKIDSSRILNNDFCSKFESKTKCFFNNNSLTKLTPSQLLVKYKLSIGLSFSKMRKTYFSWFKIYSKSFSKNLLQNKQKSQICYKNLKKYCFKPRKLLTKQAFIYNKHILTFNNVKIKNENSWIYFPINLDKKNMICQQRYIFPGHSILNDLNFDNHLIFVEFVNTKLFKFSNTFEKRKKIKNNLTFLTDWSVLKIKVFFNKNTRFFKSKLNKCKDFCTINELIKFNLNFFSILKYFFYGQIKKKKSNNFVLVIRKVFEFPVYQSNFYKKKLYKLEKNNKKWFQLNSKILNKDLTLKYYNDFLNKQKLNLKLLPNYSTIDFIIQLKCKRIKKNKQNSDIRIYTNFRRTKLDLQKQNLILRNSIKQEFDITNANIRKKKKDPIINKNRLVPIFFRNSRIQLLQLLLIGSPMNYLKPVQRVEIKENLLGQVKKLYNTFFVNLPLNNKKFKNQFTKKSHHRFYNKFQINETNWHKSFYSKLKSHLYFNYFQKFSFDFFSIEANKIFFDPVFTPLRNKSVKNELQISKFSFNENYFVFQQIFYFFICKKFPLLTITEKKRLFYLINSYFLLAPCVFNQSCLYFSFKQRVSLGFGGFSNNNLLFSNKNYKLYLKQHCNTPTDELGLMNFLSPFKGEILGSSKIYWARNTQNNRFLILTKNDLISFSLKKKIELKGLESLNNNVKIQTLNLYKSEFSILGEILSKGEIFQSQKENFIVSSTSGKVIHCNRSKITLRKVESFLLSPKCIFHYSHGDFVEKNSFIISLPYEQLKTGDIVQGIPKVEQLLEARSTFKGKEEEDNLHKLLKLIFQCYKKKNKLSVAVRKAFELIQLIIVNSVQRIYRSQGVNISDKHLEIIVKQMTSKVQITSRGDSSFFRGEQVDLYIVEAWNNRYTNLKLIAYKPILLGISKSSLEVNSFLSAASFQHTKKVLSRSAFSTNVDFLNGLKENVIIGNLISAGTGNLNIK